MALNVEAAELLEIFQWLNLQESENLTIAKKEHAKQEIADIAIYLIRLCIKLDIDLEKAILEKIILNEKKYPLFDKNNKPITYNKT
ncbi:MazG-like family protein [Arcobacter sp. YIC-310]|uniref:MazG-like family protein n=1 Tax=Arcobacter sp. YIC-310 TaxID=3376632 RepID=UPI003C1923F4